VLLSDPENLAAGTQQILGLSQVHLIAVLSRADSGHTLVDKGGGVRHYPHDCGTCRQALLKEGGGDAGGKADHKRPLCNMAADLREQALHILGLNHQDQGVTTVSCVDIGHLANAVKAGQLASSLGIAAGDDQLRGISPRTDQT
jgi:hypothetical protein